MKNTETIRKMVSDTFLLLLLLQMMKMSVYTFYKPLYLPEKFRTIRGQTTCCVCAAGFVWVIDAPATKSGTALLYYYQRKHINGSLYHSFRQDLEAGEAVGTMPLFRRISERMENTTSNLGAHTV